MAVAGAGQGPWRKHVPEYALLVVAALALLVSAALLLGVLPVP